MGRLWSAPLLLACWAGLSMDCSTRAMLLGSPRGLAPNGTEAGPAEAGPAEAGPAEAGPAEAGPAEPRRIQYMNTKKYGILDRLEMIGWLTDLGVKHNATVHMVGGEAGAREHLVDLHSNYIHENWSYYLDLKGTCGRTPFQEVNTSLECRTVGCGGEDFNALFDTGPPCVNIVGNFVCLLRRYHLDLGGRPKCSFGPSDGVREAAKQFLVKYKVPTSYGVYHIRRCDRLWQDTGLCTSVKNVTKTILHLAHVRTWLFFWYAEPGYIDTLKDKLAPLTRNGRRFIFEGDVKVNPFLDNDNYFTFMVADHLRKMAPVAVDTRACMTENRFEIQQHSPDTALHRQHNDNDADTDSLEAEMFGLCPTMNPQRPL